MDAGRRDAGTDAGRADAGSADAGADAGRLDAGSADAGVDGGSPTDAGADAGAFDAGLGCPGLPAGASPGDRFARVRTTEDAPDDEPGAAQVHVLYVEPFDRTAARALDVEGDLRRSLEAANGWLAFRAQGARLRFDRCGGAIDVTFVKDAALTEAQTASGLGDATFPTPSFIRDRLVRALRSRFAAPNKLYLVVWDGLAYGHCGGASYPPSLADHFTGLFRGGLFAATALTAAAAAGATTVSVQVPAALPAPPFDASLDGERVRVTAAAGDTLTLAAPLAQAHALLATLAADTTIPPCRSNALSADGVALGYAEFAAVHEVLHALGIVPSTAVDFAAPPIAPGHVGDSVQGGGDDLMYQGSQPWSCAWNAAGPAQSRCLLDAAHRNYFQVPGDAGVDLARSAFLTPTPPAAQLPPAW